MAPAAAFPEAFLKGETWSAPGAMVEHLETHAAHVFLAGERAYKIKKPVKLPYLDFSTVEQRRAVLENELEINRLFAADLYLGVIEKLGEPVLVMRRFAGDALLASRAERGPLEDSLSEALAAMAAEAHGRAPLRQVRGHAIMSGLGDQLATAFADAPRLFDPNLSGDFKRMFAVTLDKHATLLDRRGEAGLVRRCHGDMHCGNIIVEEAKPSLFDAIEFSERIATVDVLYDLAFLLMDLIRRDQRRAANIVLNRYLHLRRVEEDLSGLAALPLFLATRAGVRALVTADLVVEHPGEAMREKRDEATAYFEAARAYLAPRKPELVCVGGLSGTGKSTLARTLAGAVGTPPGALHIRSDIERKVLAGVSETERLPAGSYTPEASQRTYEAMFDRAGRALAAGQSVILDAVFATEAERAGARALAASGIAFSGYWLEAGREEMTSRVAARRNDASDATADVIAKQVDYDLGRIDWMRIDASGRPEETYARVMRAREAKS